MIMATLADYGPEVRAEVKQVREICNALLTIKDIVKVVRIN